MAVTRESVLSALADLAGPDGVTPLPKSGALSDVVVDGGRVYFSIAVDPARADAMEGLRKAAEVHVAAVPGVAIGVATGDALGEPTGDASGVETEKGAFGGEIVIGLS